MGLFDVFSKSGKLDRLAKKFLNEHQQQTVRQEALEECASHDTPEAAAALIRRLGVNFRDTIKNEQEKRWVSDQLVTRYAEKAIEPLVGFIRTEQSISAAIRVLARLVGPERLVGQLIEALLQYAPEDHRTISARMQIIDALADLDDARVVPAVTAYALDHDDDIRIKVISLLEHRVDAQHPEYARVAEKLVAVLTDPEASGRITRRAGQALHALDVDLTAQVEAIQAFLPDGFRLENGKLRPV